MKRTIKSFVLRAGRMSPRQQQGLDHWLADYALPLSNDFYDLGAIFGNRSDNVVEIGFGMGSSLLTMATWQPEVNFIGIEVHRAGIGSLAADLHDAGLNNVRIVPCDAVSVFNQCIDDNALDGVQIFFPDPWPKKRHHKRRLIQSDFVRLIVSKLKPGGFIHCATDWQEYAMYIHKVLSDESKLYNFQSDGPFIPRPSTRPLTKFEKRGTQLGHGVWDLKFIKT